MAGPIITSVLGITVGILYILDSLLFDPALQPISLPDSKLRSAYDFVIVGSGASAGVVASRLSENPKWTVLLVEEGDYAIASARVPLFSAFYSSSQSSIRNPDVTAAQSSTCRAQSGICTVPQATTLGGSSESNDMMYLRGRKADYDGWGLHKWSYNDVLPLFKKSENIAVPGITPGLYHGAGGPVTVSVSPYSSQSPLKASLTSAMNSLGYQAVDLNGASQNGYSVPPLTISNGLRVSATSAFLALARNRPNLDIVTGATHGKIVFDHDKDSVTKFTYKRNNIVKNIKVNKELILSAGTRGSAKALMLAGIGPAADLQALNIPVVRNLPVGANLQDQLKVTLKVGMNTTLGLTFLQFIGLNIPLSYATTFDGVLSSSGAEIVAYLNGTSSSSTVRLTISNTLGDMIEGLSDNTFSITVTLTKPKSKGTIKLASSNPSDSPVLNPGYLTNAADLPLMVAGIQAAMDIIDTPALQALGATFLDGLYPACNIADPSATYFACLVKYYGESSAELVGTCKMGRSSDSTSVVNHKLLVKGIKNLRISDNSIMPSHTTGNTYTNALMIGEKTAECIKSKWN